MNNSFSMHLAELYGKACDVDKINNAGTLSAIMQGLNMVEEYFDELFGDLFPDTMSEARLQMTKILFSLDRHADDEASRQIIADKYKERIRLMKPYEFESLLSEIDESISFSSQGFVMTIENASALGMEKAGKIQELIDTFVPPFVHVQMTGEGLTFDEWQRVFFTYRFDSLDRLGLCFDMIDTLDKERINR